MSQPAIYKPKEKTFKGTPGEWFQMKGGFNYKTPNKSFIQIYATNKDLEIVCIVKKDNLLCHSIQNFKENAQLIAAAPELLSALQLAVKAFEELGVSENQNCYKTALKAINKALK